jgi:hypothetical protein
VDRPLANDRAHERPDDEARQAQEEVGVQYFINKNILTNYLFQVMSMWILYHRVV